MCSWSQPRLTNKTPLTPRMILEYDLDMCKEYPLQRYYLVCAELIRVVELCTAAIVCMSTSLARREGLSNEAGSSDVRGGRSTDTSVLLRVGSVLTPGVLTLAVSESERTHKKNGPSRERLRETGCEFRKDVPGPRERVKYREPATKAAEKRTSN